MATIKYSDYINGVDYYALTAWAVSTSYISGDMRKNGTVAYKCILNHTSTANDEPGVGPNWTTYWSLQGDGSNTKPYKTITDASRGLTGGDEVRVAKSPAPTNLTGTLAFTKNDTAVVGTNTLFTTELALGDFIKGGDGNWWEVVVITDNTHATLYQKYSGETASGVSSQKLGITSTGEAASFSTQVQEILASGTSTSRLKISGGWDLSNQTQEGQTYFRQMHSTFSNRYGYGLYASSKSYVEIEKLHFLRYNYGIYLYSYCSNNTITSATCNSNSYGIYISFNCNNNTITSATCNSNSNYGICLYLSSNNTIISLTCSSNNYGIYSNYSSNNIVNNYSGTGNSSGDVSISPNQYFGEYPCVKCQHFKAAGDNRCYYEYGVTYRDTANAKDEGGECLKYTPTSATYYISQSFYFKADSGVQQTLSAYIKKDADFNGDVQGAIYFMGVKITGWTDITPSAANEYQQKSLVADAEDIDEDGVLELKIKVRGTAGNCFVDSLATA